MKIAVKQRDIDLGVRDDKKLCAIARAVKRKFFWLASVDVGCDQITITRPVLTRFLFRDQTVTYKLPKAARKFIGRYDKGKWVEPIEFKLEKQIAC